MVDCLENSDEIKITMGVVLSHMQAPRPAALHWSRVEPGQAFTLTLEYDSEIYEGALKKCNVQGCPCEDE